MRLSLGVIATLALTVNSTLAQRSTQSVPLTFPMRDDGTVLQASSRPRGFSLFAEEDLAGASLRLTGDYRYPFINAGGLCPFANTAGDIFNTQCGRFNGASFFFHNTPVWGIGPTDFVKIKEAWPAVVNMRAPVGYSTPWRITSIAPITVRINSADGQFGQFFAGVTSAEGEGCRDMSGAQGAGLPSNFTLTALADCPATWPGTGFGGMHELPDSVWQQRFQSNPAAFRWDDWKLPAAAYSDKPLGNNSTYGAFSDYPREIVQLYGGITPMGKAGAPPGERGFPLGIYVRADAWKFDRPSLRNGVFVRWLVINNSEKVWGKPIDYDKLYMGVDPGYILSGQSPASYNIPQLGVHVASGGGMSGRCTTTFPRRRPPGANEGCEGNRTSSHSIIMFLKSPLGDLRNKMFTDPESPFYFPSHPEADDTITFNQWRRGGFGAQEQFSWRRSDRALWGLLSGDEESWLDGRTFSDFSAAQIWTYFAYEFTDGTQSAENLKYNRSVPGTIAGYGKWDYDDDGIQDTLKLPACGSLGCSGLWGDSIAGGFSNQRAGNIGNFLGVGPFKLKGGDTTEFIFFMGGSGANGDTLATNRQIAAATTAYFRNYAGASAYPTPAFTANDVQLNSAWIRDSVNNSQTAQIRIQVKMPPRQDDPFLKTVLARINQNDAVATNLRNLNPDLVPTVTERMHQNLAEVLVFKSCDRGVSWTTDASCTSATSNFRTRDQNGADVGLGWRPFRVLPADPITGELSTYVITDNVQAGREYLYSFVTKTRSLADVEVTTAIQTNAQGGLISMTKDNLQNVLGVDIDTAISPLSASGPHTILAYAPISVPAGTIYARLDTSRTQQPDVTNRVTATTLSAHANGQFRMRFGNRFIITRTIDTVTDARTTKIIRQSLYSRATTSPTASVITNFVAAADTFVSNHDFTYSAPTQSALRTTPRTTVGTVKTFVDTITTPGYVIAQASGGSEPFYLAVATPSGSNSTFRTITQDTQELEGAPWFPGFTATVTAETAPPAPRISIVQRPPYGPRDTLNTGVVNGNGVIYQSSTSAVSSTNPAGPTGLRSSPGGWYHLEWQDAAFGPGENGSGFFTYGPAFQLQPVVDASLAARAVAMVADTTTALRTLVLAQGNNINSTGTPGANGPQGTRFPTGTRPLIAARLPFRVIGVDGQPAKVVMNQRHVPGNESDSVFRNSRLFGTNGDTTRVSIPVDAWMPGDTIYVVETIAMDSTVVIGGNTVPVVRDTVINNHVQTLPIQVNREVYGAMLPLGCASNTAPTRTTCNPIRVGTKSATGHLPFEAGMVTKILLNRTFDQNSEVALSAIPIQSSAMPLSNQDMQQIHVVPNPFVVQSSYDKLTSGRVVDANFIKFVNVPDQGVLRIYSISGQLMQQLSWTKSDLIAGVNGSPHGDLPYNLRTREGLDLSSGLYLYVLTAKGATANGQVARGKFVVIR